MAEASFTVTDSRCFHEGDRVRIYVPGSGHETLIVTRVVDNTITVRTKPTRLERIWIFCRMLWSRFHTRFIAAS